MPKKMEKLLFKLIWLENIKIYLYSNLFPDPTSYDHYLKRSARRKLQSQEMFSHKDCSGTRFPTWHWKKLNLCVGTNRETCRYFHVKLFFFGNGWKSEIAQNQIKESTKCKIYSTNQPYIWLPPKSTPKGSKFVERGWIYQL